MKRVQILKLHSQISHLKKKFKYFCLTNDLSVRQFSSGSEVLRHNLTSSFYQSVSENSNKFAGIIKSPFPEIAEIPTDLTISKYVWENVSKWPNLTAVVSTT